MSVIGEWIANAWRNMTTFRGVTTYNGVDTTVFVHDVNRRDGVENLSPAALWASQPHLRTVIDFRARNVSQLKLKVFRRTRNGPVRVTNSKITAILSKPNPLQTGSELVYDLVASRDLFDACYWFVYEGSSGVEIMPFPGSWVTAVSSPVSITQYVVQVPGWDQQIKLNADRVVAFRGYAPGGVAATPTSKVDTLNDILAAQSYSWKHRINLWLRGAQTGGYITRPKDAPPWDDNARKRFMRMFQAFSSPSSEGSLSGGVPLLEDGMDLKSTAFKSADEQWAESVKLSLETVAQVYQVNPTMVGVLDNANYSNVREFNRQLYTNTLGPDIVNIEERINQFLLPILAEMTGEDIGGVYVKFNVESKLRGSFEEQASVLSSAVGAPWMTRNEARQLQEMSTIDDGDALIIPLNLGKAETDQALEIVLGMVAKTPTLAHTPGIPVLLEQIRAAIDQENPVSAPSIEPPNSPEEITDGN